MRTDQSGFRLARGHTRTRGVKSHHLAIIAKWLKTFIILLECAQFPTTYHSGDEALVVLEFLVIRYV